jgi:ABC-type transport system involved in multi-copper enzyme maturation permease subunit
MSAIASSLSRVGTIAGNTFLEAVRQRFFIALIALAAALLASTELLREFNFGASEIKFIADIGFGALVLFGSVLTITVMAQLFFAEIESRTALTLLAKPVRRGEFIVGKFLGVWLVVLVFCAIVTALLCVVLAMREGEILGADPEAGEALVNYGAIVAAAAVQWVKLGVLGAITLPASRNRVRSSFSSRAFLVPIFLTADLALSSNPSSRPYRWLKRRGISRVISTCGTWSSPTGT